MNKDLVSNRKMQDDIKSKIDVFRKKNKLDDASDIDSQIDEIVGKHHRIFCEPEYVNSPAYGQFWEKLNRGEFDAGEYKRIGIDLFFNGDTAKS
mgnify:CR=1 FL=1